MPNPEDWYKNPNAREFIIRLYDDNGKEVRIRQRWLTEKISHSKKKQLLLFSVGLELEEVEEPIIRHCNYNSTSIDIFHTHYFGVEEKVLKQIAKSPASQMRWAHKDIIDNFQEYIRKFKSEEKLYDK